MSTKNYDEGASVRTRKGRTKWENINRACALQSSEHCWDFVSRVGDRERSGNERDRNAAKAAQTHTHRAFRETQWAARSTNANQSTAGGWTACRTNDRTETRDEPSKKKTSDEKRAVRRRFRAVAPTRAWRGGGNCLRKHAIRMYKAPDGRDKWEGRKRNNNEPRS